MDHQDKGNDVEKEDRRRLVKMLAQRGRSVDSIVKTCGSTRQEILGDLEVLGIDPSTLDPSLQQPGPSEETKNEQDEFTAIMMNAGLDSHDFTDKTLYSEGAKIVCVARVAWPGDDGLEFVKKNDTTDRMLDEAIKDVDKGGYALRQGIMSVDAGYVAVDQLRGVVDKNIMHVFTVALQPKWAMERGTEPFTATEKTAAVTFLTGVKNEDASAMKFVYPLPISTPQCIDFDSLTVNQSSTGTSGD